MTKEQDVKLINMAIVGCGGIVRNVHVRNLVSISGLKIKACVDINEVAAADMCKMCHAEYFTTSLERVLSDSEIDAVFIATLPETHSNISIRAAMAGKAVFCEKPAADTLENCRKLGEVLDRTGAKYMVGYNFRFNDSVQHAYGHFTPDYSMAQVMTNGEPKGVLHNFLNNYCHAVDLMRYFHGCNPISVLAIGNEAPADMNLAQGKMVAAIKFENGSLATIVTGSHCTSPYFGKWFYKFCDSNGNVAEIMNYEKSKVAGSVHSTFDKADSYHSGHRKELELFVDALLHGSPMPIAYEDGLWAAAVMEATRNSYESGKEVRIDMRLSNS